MSAGMSGLGSGLVAKAGAEPPAARFPAALVCVVAVGGAAVAFAASAVPDAPGAAAVVAPRAMLGAFGAAVAAALVRPFPGRAISETCALAAAALPFHLALSAAAGAPAGFHAAWAAAAAGFAALGVSAARRADVPWAAPSVAALAFALPVAAYACADFLGWPSRTALLASPVTFAALAAHDGARLEAADGLPALVVCAVLAAALLAAPRRAPEAS